MRAWRTYCHPVQGEGEGNLSWQRYNYERVGDNEVPSASPVGNNAYETNSLSPLDMRTSGSLPRRPTRMTLDTSAKREGVIEKACDAREEVVH